MQEAPRASLFFVLEEFTLQRTNYACACIQVVDMEAFHTSLGEATECYSGAVWSLQMPDCSFYVVSLLYLKFISGWSSHCGLCDLSFYIKHYELSIVALQQTGNLFRAYHACGPMSGSSSRPWIGLVDENVFLSTSFFFKKNNIH